MAAKIAGMVILAICVYVAGEALIDAFIRRQRLKSMVRKVGAERAQRRMDDVLGLNGETRRAGGQRRERARMDQSRGRRSSDALGSIGQHAPDHGYVKQ